MCRTGETWTPSVTVFLINKAYKCFVPESSLGAFMDREDFNERVRVPQRRRAGSAGEGAQDFRAAPPRMVERRVCSPVQFGGTTMLFALMMGEWMCYLFFLVTALAIETSEGGNWGEALGLGLAVGGIAWGVCVAFGVVAASLGMCISKCIRGYQLRQAERQPLVSVEMR